MGDTPDQRQEHLILFPWCELCPILRHGKRPNPAIECHHPLGRKYKQCHMHGGIVSICRECHDHVERHNWGKAVALLAKHRSGTLNLDWTSEAVGYNIRARIEEWIKELENLIPPLRRDVAEELKNMIV